MRDDATAEYFERHVYEYDPARFGFAIDQIRKWTNSDSSLIDVGCGTGTLLALLESKTGLTDLTGVDSSANALAVAAQRGVGNTYRASIIDPEFVNSISRRFDVVVMAALLHHLVARSRGRSRELATTALRQATQLLADDGHLVIVEPTFAPRWTMDLVFFVKSQVSRFSSQRIEILGRWTNIGAPVVSYYSPDELRELVTAAGAKVTEVRNVDGDLRMLPRLMGITGRWDTTVIARPRPPNES